MRLIDADALFAEIKERHDMFAECEYIGDKARRDELGAFMADIVNAPTVGGWISVKDRMPDKNEEVIICYEWTGLSGNKYREVTIDTIVNLDPENIVIAWIPLPPMPKEEEK